MLFPLFFATVYLSHLTLLRLPYFWDEGGYYIPAAWDFFRTGTLIPQSTITNAHPPLPSILLAAWWHLSGFVVSGTRTLVCMVAAAGLLAVYRIGRGLLGTPAGSVIAGLTAIYPVWFAQSTLAHADIFAAAFSLWGLSFYLLRGESTLVAQGKLQVNERFTSGSAAAAVLFSLAALSKETAIGTPVVLAFWELWLLLREVPHTRGVHLKWAAALLAPVLPLAAWYGYHLHKTGFVFGNPEFLRYNVSANLDAHRIALCLWHRLLHLTMHMNMFVPVLCAVAVWFTPSIAGRVRLSRGVVEAVVVVLVTNWIAFSVLGGALLTRYLLALYPLVILLAVAVWTSKVRAWGWIAGLSAVAFLAGIWINPPYAFAPEDNLTYRDFIVLHQKAIAMIGVKWPQATVLTAWPAFAELERPELGYTKVPIKAVAISNFSYEEVEKAAAEPGAYDTALLFSTKWAPATGRVDLARGNAQADEKYFDFHRDLEPREVAALLHGELVWQASTKGEWVAILRFPRIENARVVPQR